MPSLNCVAARTAATCAATLFAVAVHAQAPSAAEQAAYMSGLRIDRGMLAGPLAASPRSAMNYDGPSSGAGEPREVNLIGSGVVLEMARIGPDGQFVRPRVLIGRQSPELRSWMRAVGLPPERCMLPTFRGRLKRDPETGKHGAAVLVSARCTFY
jgi:hypothetical protein